MRTHVTGKVAGAVLGPSEHGSAAPRRRGRTERGLYTKHGVPKVRRRGSG